METLQNLASELVQIQKMQEQDRETFKGIFSLIQELSERQEAISK